MSLIYALDGIYRQMHIRDVPWTVLLHPDFEPEFMELTSHKNRAGRKAGGRSAFRSAARATICRHTQRFCLRQHEGAAFAFDPLRRAVLLCGGSKAGGSERLFYRRLIKLADKRFAKYLDELE
jgi:hypothetical protein